MTLSSGGGVTVQVRAGSDTRREEPRMDDHRCDPDALESEPDSQYGTLYRCPVCGRTYVDEDK